MLALDFAKRREADCATPNDVEDAPIELFVLVVIFLGSPRESDSTPAMLPRRSSSSVSFHVSLIKASVTLIVSGWRKMITLSRQCAKERRYNSSPCPWHFKGALGYL
jgi:hypothetical protein